jgi:hypothetical protein
VGRYGTLVSHAGFVTADRVSDEIDVIDWLGGKMRARAPQNVCGVTLMLAREVSCFDAKPFDRTLAPCKFQLEWFRQLTP